MFDEKQIVVVKWHSRNKEHFVNLGYDYTKIGETFQVPAYDLPEHSRTIVTCVCDYCLKPFETTYSIYKKSIQRGKLCCKDCKKLKLKDTFVSRYGISSVGESPEFRERGKKVHLEKYGTEFALQSEQGRESFSKSMLEKYGVDNPSKSKEIYEKIMQSNLERHGYKYYWQTEEGQAHLRNVMLEKYGVDNASKSHEIQRKIRLAMYNNKTTPTSKPEQKMINLLKELYGEENCTPGYPFGRISMDCLVNVKGCNIDCEYDGIFWHKDREDKDAKRNQTLIDNGYKVLRIKGNNKDDIPSKEEIDIAVSVLLDGEDMIYINMNN